MPPALDKLLASPSALRLLCTIVAAQAPPTAWLNAARCVACTCPRRNYASVPPGEKRWIWRHWEDQEIRRHAEDNPKLLTGKTQALDQIANVSDLAHRLQETARRKGREGIHEVWVSRNRLGLDLPTDDTPEAEFLWGTFVKDKHVVIELLDHAADLRRRTGNVYPRLYELCIAHWLPKSGYSRQALVYHRFMRRELQLQSLPLQHLVRINKGRLTTDMYDILLEMYKESDELNLYDEVVPELERFPTQAFRWHSACILKGDLPSPEVAASPMVQAFLARNASSSNPEVRVNVAIAASLGSEDEMDHALLRRLRGRDTAPVRFEDSFCARMFATRAVPPDSVIRGLALVGVNEIGPLAVRAMASRTESSSELSERFEQLKASGIALQGGVFSLALEVFAQKRQHLLVRSMLESDQHPEVYDDVGLQTKLLNYYLEQHDWDQAHRTLAILSLFHKKRATRAWNLLLRSQTTRCVPDEIVQTLQHMAQNRITVSPSSIAKLRINILRVRRRGRLPVRRTTEHRKGFDDLRFVARMYLFILDNDIGYISPFLWHEILRRYGMTGRMRELRRLIHWLFCWYAPRGEVSIRTIRKPGFLDTDTERLRLSNPAKTQFWRPSDIESPIHAQTHKHHPLRQLFPDRFKQALIVWGFRVGLLPNAPTEQSMLSGVASKEHYRDRFRRRGILQRLNWDIGLKTVAELRYLGLYVNSRTVVKTLQMMFINLFGRGRSHIRANRIMQAVNTTPYAEYVRRVNEIWDTPLFPEPRLYGKSKLHALMWHPRFDRVIHRRGHLKLSDIASGIGEKKHEEGPKISYVPTNVRHSGDDWLEKDMAQSEEQGGLDAHNPDALHDIASHQLHATFEAQGRAINSDAFPSPRDSTSTGLEAQGRTINSDASPSPREPSSAGLEALEALMSSLPDRRKRKKKK
ncbi:uncharacterized protein N0V89_003574 [Didymosphaeria variabile]|uniref:Pentatricopeptide repeat domain-containing protein n=1 Tax=Didymosphaeria variabile TaxID=1932322 RepID=A0A9W9CCV0_9PLEO|nr:uncharacterized protein N0V89_003574 [Didymosphaeria variabile]KAJ4355556.1 hypothetical protein N0V89_003574 [Didymosphaeria variabile]